MLINYAESHCLTANPASQRSWRARKGKRARQGAGEGQRGCENVFLRFLE